MSDNATTPDAETPMVDVKERTFPIQRNYSRKPFKPYPLRIPWSVAELAYSVYAGRYGTSQSLERLAERGGFGDGEMDEFLPDWRDRCDTIAELRRQLAALREQNEKLTSACQQAREALAGTYAVVDWPANGESAEDAAIRAIDAVLPHP